MILNPNYEYLGLKNKDDHFPCKWLLSLYESIFCKTSWNNKCSTYLKYNLMNWKDTHQVHKSGYF